MNRETFVLILVLAIAMIVCGSGASGFALHADIDDLTEGAMDLAHNGVMLIPLVFIIAAAVSMFARYFKK
jgi:hypothetical protein